MKKIYTKFLIGFLFVLGTVGANAQVTVTNPGNTTPGLAATYPDLAAAVSALNIQTAISGPVIITLDPANPQTAPAGGYSIIATLTGASAVNTVTFEGSGNTITASAALTAGVLHDAIFEIIGSDFMTIQNFTMLENAANTTTAALTNNMTEWGVALLYATTTNGAQNITIQNNTITLNRTYQNSFGIYSNSTHTSTTVTTSASATTAAGGNSGLKIYSNTINNVNQGIVVVGPLAAADYNNGVDIGGASGATANTITNYGTTGTFSGYVNVSGTVNGILVRNSTTVNISFNTVNSSVGGVTSGTLNGIHLPSSTVASTGTFTNTVNSNNISLQSGSATGGMVGITILTNAASTTSTLNMNSNNFSTFGHTLAASGTITFISTTAANQFTTINSNTFTNINVNTTGSVTFISQSFTAPATGTKTVDNNSIVTAFNKTGAGGTVTFITDNGSTVAGAVSNCTNNNFSNGTLTGATTLTGINYTDGGTAPTRTVTGNTINNWTGGTSTVNCMNFTYWNGVSSLSNNTITNITGQGTVTGITIGSTVSTATSITISSNTINNLSSTGTGGVVTGITCSNTSPGISISNHFIHTLSSTGATAVNGIIISGANVAGTNVFKNTICNLSGSNASSTVNGINITGGATVNVSNNRIADLRTPVGNAANPLNGINITGGTTVNVYYNSVYLSASSSGALFGSSALSASTTPTLTLNNNILVNASGVAGAGLAVAYRRSTATLTSYAASSNRNDFFASTIYTDGVTPIATLSAYKTLVTPRDVNSISENPDFLSTTCGNANFLKINTVTATQIESGGINIAGITDDFENEIRQGNGGYAGTGTAPDMGADEFEGTPAIPMTYVSSTTTQANITNVSTNTTNQQVIGIEIVTTGATSPLSATSFTLNTNGTTNVADIANAKIFYTGLISTFGTATLFGGPIAAPSGAFIIPGTQTLAEGTNYFWLTYDIPCSATATNVIDAECNDLTVGAVYVPTVQAPAGSRTIVTGPLNGIKTVGTGGDYLTLTEAAAAVNAAGLSGNTTLSILNSLTEVGAVTFNQWVECGAGNYTLTIKPAAATTPTISASSSTAVIILNGADRVIIDGSVGSTTNSICPPVTATRDMTITNTNTGTTSAVVWMQTTGANSATNNIVRNCNIVGNSSITTLVGIGSGSSAIGTASLGTSNNSNTIENNNIRAVQIGIYSQGASAVAKNTGNIINQNVMNSPSGSNQNIRIAGIRVGFEDNISISGNTIGSVTGASSADGFGIACGSTGISTSTYTGNEVINATITYNKIDSIRAASTFSTSGIYVVTSTNAGTNLIANNAIANAGTNGTSGDFGSGIFVGGGAVSTNIYYNSVSMSGTFTGGSQPNFALAIGGSNPIVDIRNNALSAKAVNGSAVTLGLGEYAIGYAYSTFTNLTVNNNDYFTAGAEAKFAKTGSLAAAAGADVANLAALQAATGQDAASISTDPLFNSLSNLQPQLLSPLLNAGITGTGITNDITCVTRSVTTPTIGAYEVAADVTPPVITYTPFNNTSCLTDRTLAPVTITDASGVNIAPGTRPRLYYRKSTNTNTFNDNTNATDGWKYVEATGAGGSPFSFTTDYSLLFLGVPVTTDVIEYFVVAEDLAAIPNVSINTGTFTLAPSTVALAAANFPVTGANSYTLIPAGLSGIVTIGAAGTYTSITQAAGLFEAINTNGLSGNLTVNIIDATVAETGAIALNAININACSAGPFTVTIKPGVGVTAVLTGSSASALIKLNGADNVIIDGSNNGSSSRDLTIENTSTATATAAIWISSLGAGLGATDNTVKNCIIKTGTISLTTYGIYIAGATISTTGTGADNHNTTIQNNAISKATYGIFVRGVATTGELTGLNISQNTIGSNTATDYITDYGMQVYSVIAPAITRNEIFNLIANNSKYGIYFGTNISNAVISRNNIHGFGYTNTTNYSAYGIYFSSTTACTNNQMDNNIIYDLRSYGTTTTTSAAAGIRIVGGDGYKIYFNTISLTDAIGSATSGIYSFGLMVSTASTNMDIRNNIFYNARTGGTTPRNYSIYTITGTTFSNINYNNYFTSGAALGFVIAEVLDLAALQTATGGDANSIATDPMLNSGINVQPQPGSPVVDAGDNSTGIAIDYLGTARDATPTIGAYEQAADLTGPVITYNPLNNTLCLTDRTLLPVTITDAGSGVNIAPGTRPRLYYKKTTNADTYNDNTNATDGWKYVEATGVGGSPYSFTTNYLLINGGVALGNTIQYFIVAQDLAAIPNVAINSGVFNATPTSVALTAAAFPLTGTINQYNLVVGGLLADVTIGAAGDYPTLTGVGGLFAAINSSGLLNDITARIIDAAITEDGTNSLNGVTYGCLGSYTLLIKPDVGITTVLSGTGATALINLDGADNVTFDGSNNGTSSKDMTIRNISTTGSTIRFINDATNNTVKNTIVEGAVTSTTSGVIVFSTSTGTLGNSNNAITNNDIRERSDAAATIANAIYSSGTALAPNASDTISGNNLFNFNTSAINMAATGIGNNWQLTNNNIYNAQVTPSAATQNGISIGGGIGHMVSGNFVGGNAAGATGTWTNTGNVILAGISITGAGVATISNNTVANITTTNTGTTARTRGIVHTSTGDSIIIDNNNIFNLASFGAIAAYASGSQVVVGIYAFPTTTFHVYFVSNNEVHDLSAENTAALTTSNLACGMVLTNFAGQCFKNIIYNIRNKSTGITAGQPPIACGIYARFFDSGYVYNNMISVGYGETNNVQFNGIIVVGTGNSLNDQHYNYNSIRVGGTATGTFSSHGFVRGDNSVTPTTHPVDLKNNIIYMERTGGGSVNYAIASQGTTPALDWISDYNDLYNTTTANIGFWNATGYDFANWQTTSAGDANSVSVLPNFVSTTDLHLLANNCGLDGYGTPIAGITTDYDVQTRDAGAPDMGADEFTATYGTTLAGVIGSGVCDNKNVSATGTTYATSVCDLIARVLPSGGTAVSGKINVCVTLDVAQQYFNGEPYVQRHHDISPLTNPTTSTATNSLYFTDAEFTSYNTLNPVRPPMPTVAGGGSADPNIANLLVTVFFGTPTTSPSQPGFYTIGTRAVINPLDANITWNGNYWTVTFDVTGFGGYYVHSNIFGAPLPININYFTGVKQGSNHLLNWKVTCNSTPRATMILERSADSRNFTPINTITADAARCNQPFDYTDAQPLPGMNYYRLKMIDANGAISYSGIVALLNAVKGFEIISIAPNPVTTGNFKLNVTSATAVTMQVIITDMQGRTVSRQSIPVVAGFSSIPMNAGNLAAGTYTIQAITGGEKSRIIRFVKQ